MNSKIKCLIISIFPFFAFWQLSYVSTFEQALSDSFNLTQSQVGTIASIYTYSDALFLIPVGLLLDRFYIKNLILLGISILTIGLVGQAISHTYYQLLCFRFIAGVGHAFALLCCFAFIKDFISLKQQITWFSVTLGISFLGGFVSQGITAFLLINLSWDRVLLIFAVLQSLLFLVILFFRFERFKENIRTFSFSSFKKVFFYWKNAAWALFISLLDLPIMLIGALFGISYLVSDKGILFLHASIATSMIYIGTILGTPILGFIADKYKKIKTQIIVCVMVSAISLLLIYLSNSTNSIEYSLLFFICGFFSSIQSIGYSAINYINDNNTAATAMSIVNVMIMLLLATFQESYTIYFSIYNSKYLFLSVPSLLVIAAIMGGYLSKRSRLYA